MKKIKPSKNKETFWQRSIRHPLSKLYALILQKPWLFLFFCMLLTIVALLLFFIAFSSLSNTVSQINGYKDVLLNSIKPSYVATGELSPVQSQQLFSFYTLLKSVLVKVIVLTLLFLGVYSVFRSTKDYLLKKLFLKTKESLKYFFKQVILFFLTYSILLTLFILVIIYASSLTLLFLLPLFLFGIEFIPLLQDYFSLLMKKTVLKKLVVLFVSFIISYIILLILLLIFWWILSSLFYISPFIITIIGFIILFSLYALRRLFLLIILQREVKQ